MCVCVCVCVIAGNSFFILVPYISLSECAPIQDTAILDIGCCGVLNCLLWYMHRF